MPGRHHRKCFASPIGTATPNAVYTQQGAKPACQKNITVNVSHLLLAGLPPTTFTHSKLIYTQQAAKPACQQHINAKFSHLLLAQLPRTEFTHSKVPNPLSTWPCLEALSAAPATQTGAAGQRRPGAPQPFLLEALSTAPATQTGQQRPGAPQPFLGSEYCACHTDRSRRPAATRRAATLSRGSEYCACHTDKEPRASGDQARRHPL